MKEKRNI